MSRKRDDEKEPSIDAGRRYDEVRNLYIQQLAFAWLEDSTAGATRASVDKQIGIFAQGELAHGGEVVFELFKIANGDDDVPSPASISSAVSSSQFYFLPGLILSTRSHHQATNPTRSPTRWASVKVALVRSIRKGIFFDKKYWARHSKAGDVLKPVYFLSTVMDDKAQNLRECMLMISHSFVAMLNVPSGEIPWGSRFIHR